MDYSSSGNGAVQIGGASTKGRYFNGTIDEVAIYNTALTASQVSTLYFTGGSRSSVHCSG